VNEFSELSKVKPIGSYGIRAEILLLSAKIEVILYIFL
jgi:hypothetical protein